MRKTLFHAIVGQEIAFFDKTRTGELTSRLSSDTQVCGRPAHAPIRVVPS